MSRLPLAVQGYPFIESVSEAWIRIIFADQAFKFRCDFPNAVSPKQ